MNNFLWLVLKDRPRFLLHSVKMVRGHPPDIAHQAITERDMLRPADANYLSKHKKGPLGNFLLLTIDHNIIILTGMFLDMPSESSANCYGAISNPF